MENHTFKHIDLTGTSTESSDQAVNNALAKASESVRDIQWFKVTETRGYVSDGKVKTWQVSITVGFRLAD